jgi:hypothetical protein
METLETHIKIQDLRIKVHMLSGEIEALKADQDFEYWDEKEHIINNCLVHQRSKQQEAVEPAVAEKKPGFESLYTNQSPLFDFLSASSEPRHFYVEHKEVVNPADIIDPFCIRHNEHFKVGTHLTSRTSSSRRRPA